MTISLDKFRKNLDKYIKIVKRGTTVYFTDEEGNLFEMTPIKKNQ